MRSAISLDLKLLAQDVAPKRIFRAIENFVFTLHLALLRALHLCCVYPLAKNLLACLLRRLRKQRVDLSCARNYERCAAPLAHFALQPRIHQHDVGAFSKNVGAGVARKWGKSARTPVRKGATTAIVYRLAAVCSAKFKAKAHRAFARDFISVINRRELLTLFKRKICQLMRKTSTLALSANQPDNKAYAGFKALIFTRSKP